MSKYRNALPQLNADLFLADGGIETTLIFLEKIELPLFAAFILLRDEAGTMALKKYFSTYAAYARDNNIGIVLETATWRASPDWAEQLEISIDELIDLNEKAVQLLQEIRAGYETGDNNIVISGCIGPRGDGYNPAQMMGPVEAEQYHKLQAEALATAGADLISAITMCYPEEAIGISMAAKSLGIPVVIAFTVETDGNLVTGQTLGEAILAVDEASAGYPAYYMINCAHPNHFRDALDADRGWVKRIAGIRANASDLSHAELDESEVLLDGNPAELAACYAGLKTAFPGLRVFGGCCGTDHRHIGEIHRACS